MTESDQGPATPLPAGIEVSSGISIFRIVKVSAFFIFLLILALLVFGLVVALTDAETWAPLLQIVRDIFLVILVLELVLIVTALAILMLQAAGFIIMLKTEIKPILDNARETTRLTKATAEFVSQNSVDPLIRIKSFISGLLSFLREIIRIRSILNSEDEDKDSEDVS